MECMRYEYGAYQDRVFNKLSEIFGRNMAHSIMMGWYKPTPKMKKQITKIINSVH